MGTVTRLIPRSPQGVRFNIEHDYRKLAELGWVPKTKSWAKMQRELRYLHIALVAHRIYESIDIDDPSTWPTFGIDPDDAA